jgi:hypothetical protein
VAGRLRASQVASGFDFPFVEGFGVAVAVVFCSFDQGSLLESRGGYLVPPTIYSITHFRP